MTELTNNPGPDDPGGASTPNTGNPLASSDAQMMLDGGALENDGTQWGPKSPPKTDAADNSAAEQGGGEPPVNTPLAADTPNLDTTGGEEPYLSSTGRTSSSSGSVGTLSPGLPGSGSSDSSAGRGDAAR